LSHGRLQNSEEIFFGEFSSKDYLIAWRLASREISDPESSVAYTKPWEISPMPLQFLVVALAL